MPRLLTATQAQIKLFNRGQENKKLTLESFLKYSQSKLSWYIVHSLKRWQYLFWEIIRTTKKKVKNTTSLFFSMIIFSHTLTAKFNRNGEACSKMTPKSLLGTTVSLIHSDSASIWLCDYSFIFFIRVWNTALLWLFFYHEVMDCVSHRCFTVSRFYTSLRFEHRTHVFQFSQT